jgi:hypothetical protein
MGVKMWESDTAFRNNEVEKIRTANEELKKKQDAAKALTDKAIEDAENERRRREVK